MPFAKPRLVTLVALALLGVFPLAAQTPLDATITYQGQLKQNGSPANGDYDMEFRLYTDLNGGSQVGPALIFNGAGGNPPLVAVENGLFTVALNFGATAYNGDKRFLQIFVNGTPLTPRQELTAAPYANYAAAAGAPWVVNGTNIFYTGGNVGVGTNNPAAPLHLAGPMKINSSNPLEFGVGIAGGKQIDAGKIGYQTFTADALDIVGAGTAVNSRKIKFHNEGGASFTGPINVTGGGSFTGNGVFNGSVAVGGTFASVPLHVRGTVRLDSTSFWSWDIIPEGSTALKINEFGSTRFMIAAGGNIGLGTTNPLSKLHLVDTNWPTLRVESSEPAGTWLMLRNTSSGGHEWAAISTGSGNGEGAGNLLIKDFTGNHVPLTIQADGDVGIGTTNPQQKLDVNGWVRCHVLEITGGSDLAEPFDVREANEVKPGMVVCIDPEQTGKLRLSSKAYDTKVAGVVSGANGVSPGLTLAQQNRTEVNGSQLIALTGRVWVYVDADAGGPVAPGDLLTTSDTPGHAMKAADVERRPGATLGKAMSTLPSGKGLVLVLVNLQ